MCHHSRIVNTITSATIPITIGRGDFCVGLVVGRDVIEVTEVTGVVIDVGT